MPDGRPMLAKDKLTFLLALVPYLVDAGQVSVADAAAHFELTPEEIRDAVRLIAVSGIPGQTHTYQHGDLFDISWDEFEQHDLIVLTHQVAIDDAPRFSAREAAALIAGLQYLAALPENADRAALSSLTAKLARGASDAPSQVAVAATADDGRLALLRDALSRGRRVEFDYLNARGEQERRGVDPLRLDSVDNDWYLRGWCHLRQGIRTFRLDRMTEATLTDTPVEPHDPALLPRALFESSPENPTVDIAIAATALPLIADYLTDGSSSTSRGDTILVRLPVAHLGALKRLAARFSNVMTVVGPPEARAAVADWAAAGAARYPTAAGE